MTGATFAEVLPAVEVAVAADGAGEIRGVAAGAEAVEVAAPEVN